MKIFTFPYVTIFCWAPIEFVDFFMTIPNRDYFVGQERKSVLGIQRHSPLAHTATAYIDLLTTLREAEISSLRGTAIKKTRGNKSFWYDSYRVGSTVKTVYIGPDTTEIRTHIASMQDMRARAEERRTELRRLIRILRAEGFLGLDAGTGSLLAALATAGTFRLGGTLVGTHAFRLYEGELGLRLKLDQAATTNDVDIASFERLSLAIEDTPQRYWARSWQTSVLRPPAYSRACSCLAVA